MVPSDGHNASCVCPDECPNSYGMDRSSQTICGSDGVDYKNECEMNRTACISNTNITVLFNGKCGKIFMIKLMQNDIHLKISKDNLQTVKY